MKYKILDHECMKDKVIRKFIEITVRSLINDHHHLMESYYYLNFLIWCETHFH